LAQSPLTQRTLAVYATSFFFFFADSHLNLRLIIMVIGNGLAYI